MSEAMKKFNEIIADPQPAKTSEYAEHTIKTMLEVAEEHLHLIYHQGKQESDTRLMEAYVLLAEERDKLAEELHELKRQGGEVNMERSWKKKYKYALERANRRLMKMGSQPERIRNREGEHVLPEDFVEETDGQLALKVEE